MLKVLKVPYHMYMYFIKFLFFGNFKTFHDDIVLLS